MKSKSKRLIFIILETLGLSACMLLSVFPLSCRVSVSGLEIIGTDCKVPVLESYEILDENRIAMTFSEEVNLLSSAITEYFDDESQKIETIYSKAEDGRTVFIDIPGGTEIGRDYVFLGEVENKWGSSLTFSYRFTGFNNHIPKLILTEIMDETRRYTKSKIEHKIYEFIEFYALTDGNLSGLKIYSCNDGESKVFDFPGIDVNAGDFITVHYRKNSLDGELCIDEITGDKALCQAEGASNQSWDFYLDNTEARFGASQDIVFLENSNNGKILQAILYSKTGKTDWTKDIFKETHKRCIQDGVWKGETTIEDAVSYENNANFQRNNLPEIISAQNNDTLEWPLSSDKNQWDYFKTANYTPGYCDFF